MGNLITETGYDYTNTYWTGKGVFEKLKNKLGKLIPDSGEAATDKLNLYRTMANLYYDLYNNGLCNKDIKLPPAKEYLELFKAELIPFLQDKKNLTAVKNGRRDYGAFEDVMNAVVQLAGKDYAVQKYITEEFPPIYILKSIDLGDGGFNTQKKTRWEKLFTSENAAKEFADNEQATKVEWTIKSRELLSEYYIDTRYTIRRAILTA